LSEIRIHQTGPRRDTKADVEADHRPGIWRCYGFP